MNTAINLNGKFCLLTVKINNKTFDHLLSPEFEPSGLPVTKLLP